MSASRRLPYGTWPSPITAERVARGTVRLGEVRAVGEPTFWREMRADEAGRYVIVRADPGSEPIDVTPAGFSARTRVHEYGGGSFAVHGDVVFATNDDDQRLYRCEPGSDPVAITPVPAARRALRYADMDISPDGRRVACVRELHAAEGLPSNELVTLPTDGSEEPRVIATGRAFYAFPRWSPDGEHLAYVAWDLPQMPWDGTDLEVMGFGADGMPTDVRHVAGGKTESVFQPSWSLEGRLHFISDRTDWWNLYREEPDGEQTNLTPMAAEFAVPMWLFGYSTYAFLSDGRIACVYRRSGVHRLALLDPATQELLDLDLPYACVEPYLQAADGRLAFIAGGPRTPNQVVTVDFATRAVEVLRESDRLELEPGYLSEPIPIAFPTPSGTAYAYHFPPANPDVEPPGDERPPLIVHIHGGPTSEVTPELDLETQYFTSRGFAVVDVNYGGSTGYGRPFRERLYGRWGVVDVEDAVAAASYLVERGLADPHRLVITGGSAGGWTALCALTFTDVFATGSSYFGVSDLETFARVTHKFESRYLDVLDGPWPEAADVWRERSPVRHVDRLTRPLLLLQGDEDEVVPPSQAEVIVDALEARGLPYAYLLFQGEQHGFRKAENIARALEAELAFYGRILGFEPAGPMPPIDIRNLPD